MHMQKKKNRKRKEEDKTIELREGRVGTEGVHLFVLSNALLIFVLPKFTQIRTNVIFFSSRKDQLS